MLRPPNSSFAIGHGQCDVRDIAVFHCTLSPWFECRVAGDVMANLRLPAAYGFGNGQLAMFRIGPTEVFRPVMVALITRPRLGGDAFFRVVLGIVDHRLSIAGLFHDDAGDGLQQFILVSWPAPAPDYPPTAFERAVGAAQASFRCTAFGGIAEIPDPADNTGRRCPGDRRDPVQQYAVF